MYVILHFCKRLFSTTWTRCRVREGVGLHCVLCTQPCIFVRGVFPAIWIWSCGKGRTTLRLMHATLHFCKRFFPATWTYCRVRERTGLPWLLCTQPSLFVRGVLPAIWIWDFGKGRTTFCLMHVTLHFCKRISPATWAWACFGVRKGLGYLDSYVRNLVFL